VVERVRCRAVLLRQISALARAVPSKMFEAMATGTPITFVGPKGAGSVTSGQPPRHLHLTRR
jgi:hypothetical protein